MKRIHYNEYEAYSEYESNPSTLQTWLAFVHINAPVTLVYYQENCLTLQWDFHSKEANSGVWNNSALLWHYL